MYEQLRSLLSSTSSSSSSSAAAATHSTGAVSREGAASREALTRRWYWQSGLMPFPKHKPHSTMLHPSRMWAVLLSTCYWAAGVAAKLVLGLTAGAVGQAVAVPADLIKVGTVPCRSATQAHIPPSYLAPDDPCGGSLTTWLPPSVQLLLQVRLQAEGRLVASGKLAAPRYKVGACWALRWPCHRALCVASCVPGTTSQATVAYSVWDAAARGRAVAGYGGRAASGGGGQRRGRAVARRRPRHPARSAGQPRRAGHVRPGTGTGARVRHIIGTATRPTACLLSYMHARPCTELHRHRLTLER